MIVLNGAGPNAGQTLDAWCVDLFDHLQASALYNIVPLTTAGVGFPNPILTAQQISELGSLMIHGTTSMLGNAFGLDGSAAFQLAIWNVEYQGALLDNASGALATLVAALVANVQPGGIWDCPGCSVDLLDAPAQNQVLAFGIDTTPLPGAVWLFAGGLGLLGAFTRKRHNPHNGIAEPHPPLSPAPRVLCSQRARRHNLRRGGQTENGPGKAGPV